MDRVSRTCPLLGRRPPDGSAHRLGRFLRALHAIDLALVRDLVAVEDADPVEWLADLETIDAYGGVEDPEAAMARIEFFARCAALEDLAFGRTTGRAGYAQAAALSLRPLFPSTP